MKDTGYIYCINTYHLSQINEMFYQIISFTTFCIKIHILYQNKLIFGFEMGGPANAGANRHMTDF